MLTFKRIVISTFTVAISCSAVFAQLKIQRVGKFDYPSERMVRFTGGREVEFAADGTKMIVAFQGSTVQLFDIEKNVSLGEPIQTSGDGEIGFVNNKIAYTADWKSLRLWNTKSGKQIGNAIPHMLREDTVIHPAVNPKGKYIATRPTINTVQLWDVSKQKRIGKQRKYSNDVHTIRFSEDGKLLIVRAGRSLHVIDSETGNDVAGPFPSEWRFKFFSVRQKLVTVEQVRKGSYQLVIRSTDKQGWPEIHRSNLPGKLKRIVALNDNQILLQASKNDYTPALFTISLDKPGTRINVESNADRAFGVIIPEDKQHWICSNIQNITCHKFGESKPVWQKQVPPSGFNQHLHLLNDEYFIIRDKKENFGIYKISDGTAVWKQAGVKRFSLANNKIALCNSDGVEIWELN